MIRKPRDPTLRRVKRLLLEEKRRRRKLGLHPPPKGAVAPKGSRRTVRICKLPMWDMLRVIWYTRGEERDGTYSRIMERTGEVPTRLQLIALGHCPSKRAQVRYLRSIEAEYLPWLEGRENEEITSE